MGYFYALLNNLLKILGLKPETREEIAEKLSVKFLAQFDMSKEDKAYYNFLYSLFLEYGKNKEELEEVYRLLNEGYTSVVRFLKAEEESPKLLDEYSYIGEPDKNKMLRVLRSLISKAKNKEKLKNIIQAINDETVLNSSQPSVVINSIIPFALENSSEKYFEDNVKILTKILQLYVDHIDLDSAFFVERILPIYFEIKTKYNNVNLEFFAEKTIQDIANFKNLFTKEREDFNESKKIEYKETSKIIINQIFPRYILYHVYNYGNYQDELSSFFNALFKNLLKRYQKDEALLQAVLMNISIVIGLNSTPNIIVDYTKIIDNFITDFIEIAKLPNVMEAISKNGMYFFASKKMKKEITSQESLLVNYVAFALPRIIDVCGLRLDLLSVSRKLTRDLMETYKDIEIGFYYVYTVLHRWLKVYKSETKLKGLHESLKKLLYPMKNNPDDLLKFFYFDFKDSMLTNPQSSQPN